MTRLPVGASLRVVTTDPTPPFEQVRRQLAELIAAGGMRPGERLPPVRQLAGDLGLAVGTVARAFRELEVAGLVVTRRGGGTRVAPDAVPVEGATSGADLARLATGYVRSTRALGATDGELLAAVAGAIRATTSGTSVHRS